MKPFGEENVPVNHESFAYNTFRKGIGSEINNLF